MDFHKLSRRELQVLCKRNKIPANITNVAMADSLKALEIVEGIDELLQTCESEAQSSIESSIRSEVTSPYVPPTGGRSTRRRNVAKKEPKSSRPQGTARRTVVKYADESQADAVETPAVVPQTNRKKGAIASACRKIDSQLNECIEEEKKDVLVTPAPSGAASRRRRVVKEENEVKRVYSTRRSARLEKKSQELLLKEAHNENSGLWKKDLFTTDGKNVEMNPQENLDDLVELSGITGVDKKTIVEENSEQKVELEVVSAVKCDASTASEVELVTPIDNEVSNQSGAKSELKESREVEVEEVGFGSEIEDKNDNTVMPLNMDSRAQENDGFPDVQTSEIITKVEKTEEENIEKTAGVQATNCEENAAFESEDVSAIVEVSCDTDIHDGIEKEYNEKNLEDVTDLNAIQKVLEIDADMHTESDEKKLNPDESDLVISEAKEEPIEVAYQSIDDSLADMPFDISLMGEEDEAKMKMNEEQDEANLVKDTELELQQSDEEVLPGMKSDGVVAVCQPGETYIAQPEETKTVDANGEKDEMNLEKDEAVEAQLSTEESKTVAVEEEEPEESKTVDASGKKYETNLVKDEEVELQLSTESEVLPGMKLVEVAVVEESGEIDVAQPEENKAVDVNVEIVETNMVKNEEVESQQSTDEFLPGAKLDDVAVEESDEIKAANQTPSNASNNLIDAPSCKEAFSDLLEHITTPVVDDGHQTLQSFPAFGSPVKASASKASAKKNRTVAVSDNKENICSGGKLVLTKERVNKGKNTAGNVSKYDGLSLRKLNKMVKELHISNKTSKNEDENKGSIASLDEQAPARPALQALIENSKI